MQKQAVAAYQQATKQTVPQRDLEANLLFSAASHFQRIRDDWETLNGQLPKALLFNRKLWTVFLTSVLDNASPLEQSVRQNIANLGVFVLSRTADLTVNPSAEKLDILISINRNLAAGLRGNAG